MNKDRREELIGIAAEKLFWAERGRFELGRSKGLNVTLREVNALAEQEEQAEIYLHGVARGDETVIDAILAKRDQMITQAALADAMFINGDLPME